MDFLTNFNNTVSNLWNNGEIMKAYIVSLCAPSSIEDNEGVLDTRARLEHQLKDITTIQNTGQLNGRFVKDLVDPPDYEKCVKFQLVRKYAKEYGLLYLVDVGCFSGWVGRALAVEGIKVVGIDVHPVMLYMAAHLAAGTLADFECISAMKIGYVHPKTYSGAIVFDVLEHLADPINALKSIDRSVRENGWVFINVPSPKGEIGAGRFDIESHEHLYCFSKKRLDELCGHKKNYELKEIINEDGLPNWFLKYQL